MRWSLDARIPVGFGSAVLAAEALLIEDDQVPANTAGEMFHPDGHAAGCACCGTRGPAAVALDRLFLRRVRGQTRPFDRVVAVVQTAAGEAAVRSALRDDPVVSARFRLDER